MNNLQLATELNNFFETQKSSDITVFCTDKGVDYWDNETTINNSPGLENIIRNIVVTAFKGKNRGDIIQGLQDFAKSEQGVEGRIERIDALVKIANIFGKSFSDFEKDFNKIKADPKNLAPIQHGKEKIDPTSNIIDDLSVKIAPVIAKNLDKSREPSFVTPYNKTNENNPPRNSQ